VIEELVILSGKGGTGKTSLAASFAVLSGQSVMADCDVDAADLHLVLNPSIRVWHPFSGAREAVIRQEDCTCCGTCYDLCRFGAIKVEPGTAGEPRFTIDPFACEGCGVCVRGCPVAAVDLLPKESGDWMVSDTSAGPLVHARLGVAAENSGKLVSIVRQEARRLANEQGRRLVIVDGPPGIGCPAIASVTGASKAVVVTEPTLSGEHDMERVLALLRHFSIPSWVCVNKWDLNPEMTQRIEDRARAAKATIAGRIRYDRAVTDSQMRQRAVVEDRSQAARDIESVWARISN
jgi:MinD superfamily P-loop ATPase